MGIARTRVADHDPLRARRGGSRADLVLVLQGRAVVPDSDAAASGQDFLDAAFSREPVDRRRSSASRAHTDERALLGSCTRRLNRTGRRPLPRGARVDPRRSARACAQSDRAGEARRGCGSSRRAWARGLRRLEARALGRGGSSGCSPGLCRETALEDTPRARSKSSRRDPILAFGRPTDDLAASAGPISSLDLGRELAPDRGVGRRQAALVPFERKARVACENTQEECSAGGSRGRESCSDADGDRREG